MERETRKTRSMMKSQLGHWIRGGRKVFKWGITCRFQRDWLLLSLLFVNSVSGWGYCLTRHCFLRSAFLKVIIMSLISKASLPFPLWLLFGELSVSFCFQSCCHCVCITASCQAFRGVYLDAGGLKWRPPRKGGQRALCACPWREAASWGYIVCAHTHPSFL